MQFPVIHNQSPQTRPPLQYSPQPEQEKRRQKSSSPHSQRRKSEINRNKSEVQREKENLEDLMRKFGSQARTLDEMDNESDKIKRSIEILASQMKAKFTKKHTHITTVTISTRASTSESYLSKFELEFHLTTRSWFRVEHHCSHLGSYKHLIYEYTKYRLRKSYYNSAYGDPYEAVIHGTFGAEPSSTWSTVFSGAVTIIQDFFGEVMNGGRGFGSHSYSGHVPI
ncbi:3322_t:CDS:2 [Ambispora gerdemannii]|uniref:3322_t:CDS:1 n=1 Tax=Ambispora gerdemannii TaxID=144530 RepID=A0A9N9BTP3_9GLOM|nr:3322_t:CDS:2 [Ambispora gerdemannii]